MKTRITEMLGIKYPIIQGAMAWTSEAELVAAVGEAGGAGVIATGGRTTEWVSDEIKKAKRLTNKPFGVNLMLMAPNKDEILKVLCQEKVTFVTMGAGNPVPYIEPLHAAGIKVIPVVPSVKLAKRIAASGADAIVIEGQEAGGHIGTQTTMALMENVLPEVNIPVIVAGGIVDGRGMAAALLMGAEGVQMGSRFILAKECKMHQNCKEALIAATDTDSVVTGLTGSHGAVRGLKNAFTTKYLKLEFGGGASEEDLMNMATGTNRLAAVEGDVVNGVVQSGQALNRLNKIESAQEIVESVIAEAKEAIKNIQRLAK
jgi:enoyl-[acyl-carrier protein] reductase II